LKGFSGNRKEKMGLKPFKKTRVEREWLKAALLALLINGVLFGIMPRLQGGMKGFTDLPSLENPVDIFRVKRLPPALPEKEKPRPREEEKEPQRKKTARDLVRQPLSPKPKLPFEVNAKLPAGPGVLPTLDVSKYDLHGRGPGLFEEHHLDQPLRPLVAVNPLYPLRAKRMGISGWVKVRFMVTREGRVENAEVLESDPKGIFDHSALVAVFSYRFSPPMVAGEAVEAFFTRTFTFRIEDE
jgi:protein TonB